MKKEEKSETELLQKYFNSPFVLLGIGFVLNLFSQLRWNIPIVAWLAIVPYLRYVRLGHSKIWLAVALLVTFIASTARLISEPFHIMIALMAGIQTAIFFFLVLHAWNFIRKKRGEIVALFFLPSLLVAVEWFSSSTSALGTWGMLANSQLENLPLLQLSAITGAYGVSFIIAWANSLVESMMSGFARQDSMRLWKKQAALFLFALILIQGYGTYRLFSSPESPTIRVATVTTKFKLKDVLHDAGKVANNQAIFSKTKRSADMGAKIVIWNEGAAILSRSEEEEFIKKTKKIARDKKIHIVAAYGILIDGEGFKIENKLQWIAPEGKNRWTYYKQFIPPGEPSVFKKSKIKAIDIGPGLASAAICYDFDSMSLTRRHAKNGVGLVAIPASDWKGIDPYHAQMTALRGIENGYSVVRSTRAAVSVAFDPFGRVRAWQDYYGDNDGIMIASVPVKKIKTIYNMIGDLFPMLTSLYAIIVFAISIFLCRKNRQISAA